MTTVLLASRYGSIWFVIYTVTRKDTTSARLHVLIFYLSCLFSPNMEGLGHFRLSDNSMGNQATISDIKMESIA